jgi:hypothetical protein
MRKWLPFLWTLAMAQVEPKRKFLDGAQTPQRSGVTSNINVVNLSARITASIPTR